MATSGACERICSQNPRPTESRPSSMKTAAIGFVKKIRGDPWDMSSACPKDVSSICARTVASTMGATGHPNLRMKYPITPNKSMTQTSNAWNRNLNYNNDGVNRNNWNRRNGFSVRCLQN